MRTRRAFIKNIPLTISRIGHSRGRPVAQGFGKWGAMTRHSVSVKSVWYRVTVRLCFDAYTKLLARSNLDMKADFG